MQNEKSANGYIWQLQDPDRRLVNTISQKFDLPIIVSQILVNRDVNIDEVEEFLEPTIKNSLPNPNDLIDMQKAILRIVFAIENNQKIAVFGDYDVDGATSSSLLKKYFAKINIDLIIYIPDRQKEGYGPNSKALLGLKQQGVELCITVDCGTMAFEALSDAKKAGLDVIVIDHHLSAEKLPESVAIINPNRLDENSQLGYLAAVGVVFMTLVSLNSYLKKIGFFDKENIKSPNLLEFLDIVALGTVCDVVPLKKLNRAFVKQGLKIISKRTNVGLNALSDVAQISSETSAYHLGYILGPRINAGGRVGKSSLGSKLLCSDNNDESLKISYELDLYNQERKAIEQHMLDEAFMQVEKLSKIENVIFVKSENWHQGVIGIVASRIKERYNRPTAVISIENGIGKASARSITGYDFGANIVAANQNGLLIAGGGHSMAAGFSVEADKIDDLQEFLIKRAENIKDLIDKPILKIDGNLTINSLNINLANQLKMLEPYGVSNSTPRFLFENIKIYKANIVGKKHVSCIVGDNNASGKNSTIKAIAFGVVDTKMGDILLNSFGKNISIVGKISINHWQGVDKVQLIIEDLN